MDETGPSFWTLSLRLEGDVLACALGDGRRLAWHASVPAQQLSRARPGAPLAEVIGTDLAQLLHDSEPRPLGLVYPPISELDEIAWEGLRLGVMTLAQKFCLGRLFIRDHAAQGEVIAPTPGETLMTVCLHADTEVPSGGRSPAVHQLSPAALAVPSGRALLAQAQIVLASAEGWPLLQAQPDTLVGARLWVLEGQPSLQQLARLQDAGRSILILPARAQGDASSEALLLRMLREGSRQGAVLRALHMAGGVSSEARLYGDPEWRYARAGQEMARRQISSLSFDLVGSTELLRRLGDEAYAEALMSLHQGCADIARRCGGRPDEPQGDDGVMCYFGYPLALEQAAVRALEAGLQMLRLAEGLGLPLRVGVATGAVAIMAGQPVGLSIHLAARLQQVAAPGSLLVSEATRDLVQHAFILVPQQDLPVLKGLEGQTAYRVQKALRSSTELGNAHEAATSLIGREAELRALERCVHALQQGEDGLLALVSGEAGMGKSRLLREFRQRLHRDGFRVLELRCRLDASESPFLALAEALRRWLEIDPEGGGAQQMMSLRISLPTALQRDEPLGLIADLLGIRAPVEASQGSVPRGRVMAWLVQWMLSYTQGRPACLVVEDWHWVDPSTRDFVQHLLQYAQGLRLLIVLASRDSGIESARSLVGRCEHVRLRGLVPEAARELVAQTCAQAPLPAELVRQLAERGAGVPLFLEESARLALQLGRRGAAQAELALSEVPSSLQDVLNARLDALGRLKPLAQMAAVLGRSFSRDLLAALMAAAGYPTVGRELDQQLQALCLAGLLRYESESLLAFHHALIRDAAYDSLWTRDRQHLHAHVVDLLRQHWPEQVVQQPELLAQHLTEAGLLGPALDQWELAASRASARSAVKESVSHLRRALGVLRSMPSSQALDQRALRLQLQLAASLIAAEGYGADAVREAYEQAQTLCQRVGDVATRFKVEMGIEAYRFMRAEFRPALEHALKAAAIADSSGDPKQRLQAHWGMACTLFHQGRLRAAMRQMEDALVLYTPAMHAQFGIQDPGVMCMAYSSWGLWEFGRPDAALQRISEAMQLADEYGHRYSQAVATAYAVSVELLRGDTDDALRRAEHGEALCERYGFPVWLAIIQCMRGHLLCVRGSSDEGIRQMRAGLSLWLSTGARVSLPLYLSLQGEGLRIAGQLEAAAACVEEGLRVVEQGGERQLEAELHRLRGEIALERGDATAAELWLKRSYGLALRRGRLAFALRSATSLAGIWRAQGRTQRALRLLQPLQARWREGLETRDVRVAARLVASLQGVELTRKGES